MALMPWWLRWSQRDIARMKVLPAVAAVVYTPVCAISRPEFTAAAKAW
jgi:hypothetical protein